MNLASFTSKWLLMDTYKNCLFLFDVDTVLFCMEKPRHTLKCLSLRNLLLAKMPRVTFGACAQAVNKGFTWRVLWGKLLSGDQMGCAVWRITVQDWGQRVCIVGWPLSSAFPGTSADISLREEGA